MDPPVSEGGKERHITYGNPPNIVAVLDSGI